MRPAPRILGCLALALAVAPPLVASLACSTYSSDAPVDAGPPNALGTGLRINQMMRPPPPVGTAANPDYPQNNSMVTVTGATYLLVDGYDETHNGKSIGTVYMQDVPSPGMTPPQLPYSGVAIYKPTYVPTNLVPAPGDVLDFTGTFSVSTTLGAAVFSGGTALTEIDEPVIVPRFEYTLPPPLVIQATDLDNYNLGQQWTSMLCTIENITFVDDLSDDGEGRDTIHIDPADTSENGPTLDNELFDVATWNSQQSTPPLEKGQTIKSVTGIVTWFFNYHIAPRSPADIVVQ
ncbi:MAG: hypothetical protein ACLQVI_08020 [Polyangiaceae bacterium]